MMTNIMLVAIVITMIMMIETSSSTLQSSCEWPTSLSGVFKDYDAKVDYHDHDIGDGDYDDYELNLAEQPWVAHELEGKCQ